MNSFNKEINTKQEFYKRVKKTKGCWLWNKYIDPLGYGRCQSMGFNKSHRLSYFLHFGDFDRKLYVLHKCDVRHCVNPKHLFLGTQDDNMKDCARKKRIVNNPKKGIESHLSKLSNQNVLNLRQMRKNTNLSYSKLAKLFNISTMTAYRAINKINWKHL